MPAAWISELTFYRWIGEVRRRGACRKDIAPGKSQQNGFVESFDGKLSSLRASKNASMIRPIECLQAPRGSYRAGDDPISPVGQLSVGASIPEMLASLRLLEQSGNHLTDALP